MTAAIFTSSKNSIAIRILLFACAVTMSFGAWFWMGLHWNQLPHGAYLTFLISTFVLLMGFGNGLLRSLAHTWNHLFVLATILLTLGFFSVSAAERYFRTDSLNRASQKAQEAAKAMGAQTTPVIENIRDIQNGSLAELESSHHFSKDLANAVTDPNAIQTLLRAETITGPMPAYAFIHANGMARERDRREILQALMNDPDNAEMIRLVRVLDLPAAPTDRDNKPPQP